MKITRTDFFEYRPRNILVSQNGCWLQYEVNFMHDEIYYYVVDKRRNEEVSYFSLDDAIDAFNELVTENR